MVLESRIKKLKGRLFAVKEKTNKFGLIVYSLLQKKKEKKYSKTKKHIIQKLHYTYIIHIRT